MTKNTVTEEIRQTLQNTFSPHYISVIDESHLHIGHAGAVEGKGHYSVEIHANAFSGKTSIQRHRMVFDALSCIMTEHIHALSIKTKT